MRKNEALLKNKIVLPDFNLEKGGNFAPLL